jgi:hypothetical protein
VTTHTHNPVDDARGNAEALKKFKELGLKILDTMIQATSSKKTCSWNVEASEDGGGTDHGDGDITLRRV